MNFILNKIVLYLMNVKIKIHGNSDYLNDSKMLVMSNHYTGLDGFVFISILNKPLNNLYIVAKSDFVGNAIDKNAISYILSFIKNLLVESTNLILYKRGDRESGDLVKNTIVEKITNDNSNALVFPEGTTHKNGVLKEFKNGIFHLASDENITILPVTLIYDRPDFGFEKGEELNLLTWFNITCNVHVHEKIRGNNWEELKQQTFNTINDANTKNK
jgi:1-acyl-sn-glycerol-3-phosphate acyltransferase